MTIREYLVALILLLATAIGAYSYLASWLVQVTATTANNLP